MRSPPSPMHGPVTIENWDSPSRVGWALRNMRRLFPTANVSRGSGPVCALEHDLRDLDRLSVPGLDGRPAGLAQCLAETATNGFLVLHRGRIAYERYFNGLTPEAPHNCQSVSKSILGDLVGLVVDEGLLDLTATVAHYVPELARSGYADATLQQVLDMTTGVAFDEAYMSSEEYLAALEKQPALPSDGARLDIAAGWKPRRREDDPASIYDLLASLRPGGAHGVTFTYRSVDTDVLGWVVERATGAYLPDLLAVKLWSRLGAEADAYYTIDRVGTALADGGFCATVRDLARFGQMHLELGRFNGAQIVPSAWVRQSRTGDHGKFRAEPFASQLPKGAYSNQWWVKDCETGVHLARGIFGQMIYIDPAAEMVAVKFSAWPKPSMSEMVVYTLRAMEAIAETLTRSK